MSEHVCGKCRNPFTGGNPACPNNRASQSVPYLEHPLPDCGEQCVECAEVFERIAEARERRREKAIWRAQ